jgi:hypothetical protein
MTPRHLLILLHIRRGARSLEDLNVAMPAGRCTRQLADQLRARGYVTAAGQRTLKLTDCGRQAIRGYVLMPGGKLGKWCQVEEVESESKTPQAGARG